MNGGTKQRKDGGRRRAATPVSAEEAARYERAMRYMKANFRTATLVDVAAAVGISPFHFHRRFTLWAGRTPGALMADMQIEHAKRLLEDARIGLREVAARCGFAHQSHFTSRFHQFVGTTPRRWRRARQVEAPDAQPHDEKAAA